MCRTCGAIVAAGEGACPQCGTPLANATAQQQRRFMPDIEAMRFARAVLARPAIFTFIFLIANIFIFLLMTFSGGASGEVLVAYGAKVNNLIDREGEWWRFVTPMFLHVNAPGLGPLHLLSNMYGLWVLGPYVERIYGSARFVVFWIGAGIAGVAASYMAVQPDMQNTALERFLFKAVDIPSAGASGALFGLIGVLFVFGIKYRAELPEGFRQAFGTGMLPTILINVFIGYAFPFIDNAAHLGGLVTGAALALVVGYKRPGKRGPVAIAWHALQFAALALVAVSFWFVYRNFNIRPPEFSRQAVSRLANVGAASVQDYLTAINEGQQAFVQTLTSNNTSSIDRALARLDRAPKLDTTADDLRNELKLLLWQAKRYAEDAPSVVVRRPATTSPERRAEGQNLATAFQSWVERFNLWVELDGVKYGITRK